MTDAAPLLQVQQVSKVFDGQAGAVQALDRVSFDVAEGQFVAIVGPSGCGKSTLLSIVAGLDAPTTGDMILAGRRLTGPGTDRGMVFQGDCLFPWLTVAGNVRFGMHLRANAGSEAELSQTLDRSDGLIEAVGLTRFKDAYPSQLSGGMRQRAAIARALLHQPRLLLMDEPFGALDAQTRENMQDLLLGLCARQTTTVLFVTHDVEEAIYISDRVLVLAPHPGRLIEDIPITLDKPRDPSMKLSEPFTRYRARLLELLYTRTPATEAVVAGS